VAKKEIIMTTTSSPAIDLAYRPNTYFWAHDNKIRLASDIKGAERKALYEKLVNSGQNELADTLIAEPVLSEQGTTNWGRLHPGCMGGEYLPDRTQFEVEIARITIASTTHDTTSIYAKRSKGRIYYKVVDEYGGDTLQKSHRTSIRPLTLKQLTDFFITSWDLLGCLEFNFSGDDYPRDTVHGFIIDASSSFYAEFESLVHQRISEWLDEKIAALEPENDIGDIL